MASANSSREAPHEVVRSETAVMYLETEDEPEALGLAWRELEARLGSLRGRHFFGTFAAGRYRAGVQLMADDTAEALGFEIGVVPGGRYLRIRLSGEPPALYDRISLAFETLESAALRDAGRPCIEFYRSRDQVDLLMPMGDQSRSEIPGRSWLDPRVVVEPSTIEGLGLVATQAIATGEVVEESLEYGRWAATAPGARR